MRLANVGAAASAATARAVRARAASLGALTSGIALASVAIPASGGASIESASVIVRRGEFWLPSPPASAAALTYRSKPAGASSVTHLSPARAQILSLGQLLMSQPQRLSILLHEGVSPPQARPHS